MDTSRATCGNPNRPLLHCHQIKLTWTSGSIFTVTAMSEGQYEPLEGCLCLWMWISSYCTRPWQNSLNHGLCVSLASQSKSLLGRAMLNAKIIMTSWISHDISCGFFFQRLELVALLDHCTLGATWKLPIVHRDAQGGSNTRSMTCPSNAWGHKQSSRQVLNLIWWLLIHVVPVGLTWWLLGCFLIIDLHNAWYEFHHRNSTIYIWSSCQHPHENFRLYWTHYQYTKLSCHHMTCTNHTR